MPDPRIPLKNPWIAGILAFLLPGAGHLYQGRLFKAGLYSVCILGLFLTGMAMADWQAVQTPPRGAFKEHKWGALLKYAAQAASGAPALSGMVQRERYYSRSNVRETAIPGPFAAPLSGAVSYQDAQGYRSGDIAGTIYLEPAPQQFGKAGITGRFEGTLDGQPLKLDLSNHVELAKPVDARQQRTVIAGIVDKGTGRDLGQLQGGIPRPFWNWVSVPMDENEQQEFHGRLGKYHELAMVFTWIAGLLNVLAIWDAVEGPAYGYGDEPSPETPKSE
jgi:hypothetical protein